ncbi:MAG TPA: glycosyltransferase, partial [Ferruginibacter sp.]|nr:glycosyltransferase [Ferruginibacter sp.]
AAVLTFPSYREGFPNVPMQAGAMGCMLILSNINGCNELVQDGADGKLVPVKNTEALLQAMLHTREHPAERDRMATAIREKIKQQYDQPTLWKLMEQEYQYWLTKNKQ